MTTSRIVALLLVANTGVFVVGALTAGSGRSIGPPIWLPPLWLRAGIPLAVAGGLWFGQRWAWWAAIVMCAGLLLWVGVASFVLGLGGYFTEEGAALRALHLGLLVATWLAALGLLLSGSSRAIGRG
ncbi:MAG: hypothetical protein AUG01_11245 [Candidatus Rokubacteria bacterium 13_1_20CM_2_69_58]|nr:MAG: hypothetical protein AUG01_11245 [Candidatus Rokubacteria bacterium 13_1_20CM_2_69_58]